MMKESSKLLAILTTLALVVFPCASQVAHKPFEELDKANLSVRYHFEMKKDAMGSERMSDTMILLCGDKVALSYTISTLYADSLQSTDEGQLQFIRQYKNALMSNNAMLSPRPHTIPDYTYTDLKSDEVIVYESDNLHVPIFYREARPNIFWHIRDYDSRVIAGFKTYKAVCDFRGRRYEAWYTDEIPCEMGPWKFYGLPGLILEVYDEDRDYFWTAIDVRIDPKPSVPIRWIQYSEGPVTEVERIPYLRDIKQFLEGGDPEENETLQRIISSGARKNYRQKRPKPLSYDFLERDYREEASTSVEPATETDPQIISKDSLRKIPGEPSADHLLVKYEYTHLKDTLNGSAFAPDYELLEIRPDLAIFYSLKTYQMKAIYSTAEGKKEWQQIFDREISKLNTGGKMSDFLATLPRNGEIEFVVKSSPAGDAMRVYDRIGPEQYYYDDEASQHWSLTDSTRVILGYSCQQATSTFRGREWVAWFTYDVPIGEGPWKLHGLPGLICEAYDRQQHYHYLITGLEQKKVSLDYTILIDKEAKPMERMKLIDRQEVYSDSGGELAILGVRRSSDHYPKPRELR